jgi:hypothetical protein
MLGQVGDLWISMESEELKREAKIVVGLKYRPNGLVRLTFSFAVAKGIATHSI